MQFGPDLTTELIVPANVPFQPGQNVIGIGTDLPPELAAYTPYGAGSTVEAALIFYSSQWDPNATTPRVKYQWLGVVTDPSLKGVFISIGTAFCDNPSVSHVATVISIADFGTQNIVAGHPSTTINIQNRLDDTIISLGEIDTQGAGGIATFDENGNETGQLPT